MPQFCRVAENPQEQAASPPVHNSPATAFWSKYWNNRVPDYRDMYTRDYDDDEYDHNYDDNNVGIVRTKSRGRNTRLDPRHVQMPHGDEDPVQTFENSNALRLKSSASDSSSHHSFLPLLCSFLIMNIMRLWSRTSSDFHWTTTGAH